jgi:hypothetical protein
VSPGIEGKSEPCVAVILAGLSAVINTLAEMDGGFIADSEVAGVFAYLIS